MSAAGGVFVVFEGGDGVGRRLRSTGSARGWPMQDEVLKTFEPGDTTVGAMIRRIVLDPATGEMSPRALRRCCMPPTRRYSVVRPALERGAVVVCDRYVDSMLT